MKVVVWSNSLWSILLPVLKKNATLKKLVDLGGNNSLKATQKESRDDSYWRRIVPYREGARFQIHANDLFNCTIVQSIADSNHSFAMQTSAYTVGKNYEGFCGDTI